MQLVIAEKPSVGMALSKVLGAKSRGDGYMEGGGWLVSWCIGHLVELAPADAYDPRYSKWNYADLPILPKPWQFQVLPDTKKQFEVLKTLIHRADVTALICATDAGREGGTHFPPDLPSVRLHQTRQAAVDFLNGGSRNPERLRQPAGREELRQSLRRRSLPRQGGLADRHQRYAPVYHTVPGQVPERGPGADPDAGTAGRTGSRYFRLSEREILHGGVGTGGLSRRQ